MRLSAITEKVEVLRVLRHRDFRLYWFGFVASVSGLQTIMVVQGWLIWELTKSEFLLGAVSLMEAIPAIGLALFAGAVADKVDIRRFLIFLQGAAAVTLLVLATLIVTEVVQVWHIFVSAFVLGVLQAFDHPGRNSIFPHLVDRRELIYAVSLNSTVWPGTRIFGPALAGVVIDRVGEAADAPLIGAAAAYYVASLGFILFGLSLSLVRLPAIERAKGRNVLQDIVEGVKYVWGHTLFAFLIGFMFINQVLVNPFTVLLPVFATDVFHGNASTLGLLIAATGAGSFAGAVLAAALAGYRRRGWLIFSGVAIQSLSVILFATSDSLGLSLLLLVFSGVGHGFFTVPAQTTVQQLVPDQLRGRVMSMWGMTHSVASPLGRMQMGTVAGLSRGNLDASLGRLAGAPFALILGGSVILGLTAISAGANRQVRTLDARELATQQQSLAREYRDLQA